ncbi:hypothetical protein EXM22_03835 [Oceanispirochaeta crateris]|uniref:HemY N-terminal domain-containing protein n=1 Tax=Oceanispirochaeta crateris TaxID=2518645 RepID=A0A5C1QJ31_9SPIO|nr:hypothetical protein [Oceanispirochaeta crateris]QEN07159.1 hypothetical protein EXM22_03835 [Oceanispirochaeta crateris]
MKFKTIFFLFNGIILFSFLFIALMPLFVLGAEYTRIFWGENWFLALLFLIFISVLDAYFMINWKMFSLLEKEDWPGLTSYLETEIYEKKRLSSRNIRMMVNTSLTISNLDKIIRLEKEVSEKKPSLLSRYGAMLGIPYLLNQNKEEGKIYFKDCIAQSSAKDLPWLEWCYSFLLLADQKLDEAKTYLSSLSAQTKDSILRLLSLYLLSTISGKAQDEALVQNKRSFIEQYPDRQSLEKDVLKSKNKNIVVLLLSSVLDDSQNWLYDTVSENNVEEINNGH